MEVSTSCSNYYQHRPDEVDAWVDMLSIIFEKMNEKWWHQEEQDIAKL